MALIFWMLQHLGVCKGFFMIKEAKSPDGVHTIEEVDAYIYKCLRMDATAGMID